MIKVSKRVIAHEKKAEHSILDLLNLIEDNTQSAKVYVEAGTSSALSNVHHTLENIKYFVGRIEDALED